jgi:hypothetical protein
MIGFVISVRTTNDGGIYNGHWDNLFPGNKINLHSCTRWKP